MRKRTTVVAMWLATLMPLQGWSDGPLPVIDMHLHAFAADAQGPPPLAMCTPAKRALWDQRGPYGQAFMGMFKQPPCEDPIWSPETDDQLLERTVAAMERRNVYGVLSGAPDRVADWRRAAPGRFYAGLGFLLATDRAPTVEALRSLHERGQLDVLAEIVNQYAGIRPDDARMDPYWALMESLDVPVGIHIGPGPPGVVYLGSTEYRARLHSPLYLEDVLVKYPKLRVYIMHAGYPMVEDLLALMHTHPQVYAEVGVIVFTLSSKAFYRFLERIVEDGFGKRVMFGSDQMVWPETIERGIDTIERAPFLSDEQKRDILYHNAARFLRLSQDEIDRHHGR